MMLVSSITNAKRLRHLISQADGNEVNFDHAKVAEVAKLMQAVCGRKVAARWRATTATFGWLILASFAGALGLANATDIPAWEVAVCCVTAAFIAAFCYVLSDNLECRVASAGSAAGFALQPLAESPRSCQEALDLVAKSKGATAVRDAVVGRGEELRRIHLTAMHRAERAEAELAAEAAQAAACRQLHGLAPAVA